ncbi:MAG: hypothetical protein AAGF12_06840 [Myxococcota bacterium]
MKLPEIEALSPVQRRRFLKVLGAAMAAPFIPAGVRFACNEIAGGVAHAQMMEASLPTYFVEINLRDQWDHGHFMVAPGIATYANLRRGEDGDACAMFFQPNEITSHANNVYLTPQSAELAPHLDNIAMVDTCEMFNQGIHGHESGNPIRSPGKRRDDPGMAGYMPIHAIERELLTKFPGGNEAFWSATPTPASLHNYAQKQLDPTLRNGYTVKGISRSIHTVYHFGGTLAGAELDRIQSRDQLLRAFPESTEDLNVLASEEEAELLTRVLGRVDQDFFARRGLAQAAREDHTSQVEAARGLLYTGLSRTVSVPLTDEERAYWSDGVPNGPGNFEIWEQAAWAFKILRSGMSRTAAIEFDIVDIHGSRRMNIMERMTRQAVLPFVRLIESFKAEGMWDRTCIAMYTTDMSRPPSAGHSGDRGKNTLILAGGRVQGGYFGDLQITGDRGNGHEYSYHAPDVSSGAPRMGVNDNSDRLDQAAVWRTVMKAAGVSDTLADSFPDTQGVAPLNYMLRA